MSASKDKEMVGKSEPGKYNSSINESKNTKDVMDVQCSVCKKSFADESSRIAHIRTLEHQNNIMSDEDKTWHHRAPPRGISADQYDMCESFMCEEVCHFGNQCIYAHSAEELTEWNHRFTHRQKKVAKAKNSSNFDESISYREAILEKCFSATDRQFVTKENERNVKLVVHPENLDLTVSSENSTTQWNFTFSSSKKSLRRIVLLHDAHRSHFNLLSVKSGMKSWEFESQEWINKNLNKQRHYKFDIKVGFSSDIFGRFYQSIAFECDNESILIRTLNVCVVAPSDIENIEQVKETVCISSERWDFKKHDIIRFPRVSILPEDQMLLNLYQLPSVDKFVLSQTVLEPKITMQNYRSRYHELLHIEEMAQNAKLSRFNVSTTLKISNSYTVENVTGTVQRHSNDGEMFARLRLQLELSEDTASGRLVLTNCNSVLLMKLSSKKNSPEKPAIYEAVIEDKEKEEIYLSLSSQCVKDLGLKSGQECNFQVQFQLNRLPFCEMHAAVEQMSPKLKILFPNISASPLIPWSPDRQWNKNLDNRLNPKQKEAILAVTCDSKIMLPPIILVGPFGTGKTFTLAHAIKQIINLSDTRILVCTHSNSAADLYIKDYLHDLCKSKPEAKPLRIFYVNRRVETVDPIVLQYSKVHAYKKSSSARFVLPSKKDIFDHRIVVTTLNTSRVLLQYQLPEGFFTHILIDEAAQALECEAIMPLSFASLTTKIILAGDHMQLSPEVHSKFCCNKKFSVSLLERLYDMYPSSFNCKILLCENYRSHGAIMEYTSQTFYDNKLVSSGKQPPHGLFYPVTFFTARGQDSQYAHSTSFHNDYEVYELVRRVCEVLESWPESWGEKDHTKIGIVTPYYDQVLKIRAEIRKRRLRGVNVERVQNVQGKQFRALFISTVRTQYTCLTNKREGGKNGDENYGFLSDVKLFTTAVTRAQSLVAVVGDPVALCSIGKCRKVWEKFITVCSNNKSLYGIQWQSLRSQLDGVEMKKSFQLNPLAPEFIPKKYYQEEPYLLNPNPYYQTMHPKQSGIMANNSMLNYPVYPPMHPYMPYPPPPPHLPSPAPAPNYFANMFGQNHGPFVDVYGHSWIPPTRPNHGPPLQHGFFPPRMQGVPLLASFYSANHNPWANKQFHSPSKINPLRNPIQQEPFIVGPHDVAASQQHLPSQSPNSSMKPVKRNASYKNSLSPTTSKQNDSCPTNCELDFYFPVLKGLIPSNCSLKVLLKSQDVQETWIKHIHRQSGSSDSDEFKKCLDSVRRLVEKGHSSPPYIGETYCKICASSDIAESVSDASPKKTGSLLSIFNSSSSEEKNGEEKSIVENSESNNSRPNVHYSHISQHSMNDIDPQESCPVEIVSKILNENIDLKDRYNSPNLHNEDTLVPMSMNSVAFKNDERRASWTPTLTTQPHSSAKCYNCYNSPCSANCDLNSGKCNTENQRTWRKRLGTFHNTENVLNRDLTKSNLELNQSNSSRNSSFDSNCHRDYQNGDSGINSSPNSLSSNKDHVLGKPLTYAGVVRSNMQKNRDASQSPNFLSAVDDLSMDTSRLYRHF